MIRIALVEDEAEVRAQLQGYVQRSCWMITARCTTSCFWTWR